MKRNIIVLFLLIAVFILLIIIFLFEFEKKEDSVNILIICIMKLMRVILKNAKLSLKIILLLVLILFFYDKEIMGCTFIELCNVAKLKVISILIKIDNKIEKYAPGYKESISNTGSMVYNDIKERLIIVYFDTSTKMCSNNTYECDRAKEIFGDVRNECKIGLSCVKKAAISGGRKIKDWYEVYSGK